jgi:hypothetical protein
VKLTHNIVGGIDNNEPLVLGARGLKGQSGFDGLIDDIRLSESALETADLLFTREGTNKHTVGYWQFESKPGVFRDGSGHGYDIHPPNPADVGPRDIRKAAWADFCHILLNSSEFLYVE